jgi:uncharacterized protein YpmB
MKEKHRMIVVFLVFLLAVIVVGAFVYKASKNTGSNNERPQRQTKKVEIKLRLLDSNPLFEGSEIKEALLEIEDNEKVIFNLKAEEFKDYEHGGFFMRKD